MSNSSKLESRVKTILFYSENRRQLDMNENNLKDLQEQMNSVLTIFSEVLSMPSRSNEWKRLSLVPMVTMQSSGFWGSY